jgi:sugar phosphate isomerase/epimerase
MFSPKLSVSLHMISTKINEELIDLLEKSRIDSFELALNSFAIEDIALLKNAVHAGRIKISSIHARHGEQWVIATDDANVWTSTISEYSRAIDIANEFDAGVVVLHASSVIESGNRTSRITYARKALWKLDSKCEKLDVQLAVEYLPRTCIGNTKEELLAMLEGVDLERVGVCLDVNHLMDKSGDLPEVIGALGYRIFEVHLSDYDGVDEKHWIPGEGIIDWKALMASFSEINYSGLFNYEAKLPGKSPKDKIKAVQKNFDWLLSLISKCN